MAVLDHATRRKQYFTSLVERVPVKLMRNCHSDGRRTWLAGRTSARCSHFGS